jgi:uncharacterized protein YbjT (DUF2867 family)
MILVIGGTGRLGSQVVNLLQGRQPVRVMTRNPRPARNPADGVEIVHGDLHDPPSLDRALHGVTAVVCTAHGGDTARPNGPKQIEGAALPRLIDAAAHRRLRQFIYISSASARPDSPADLFRRKAAVEALLAASGLPYSVLRPTHLLDTWAGMLGESLAKRSRAMVLGSGENPVSFVAASDVAQAVARLAPQDGEGLRADLGGPNALTITELNDLIATRFAITVRSRMRLSVGVLRSASRILRPFTEVTSRQLLLGALLDSQPQVVDATTTWNRLGIQPTTAQQWLDDNAATLAEQWQVPAPLTAV